VSFFKLGSYGSGAGAGAGAGVSPKGFATILPALIALAVLSLSLAVAGACGGEADNPVTGATPGPGTPSVQSEFLSSVVVERVIDGSTILVSRDGEAFEVRYLGIEIPDLSATAAVEQNRHLVEGQTVELEIDVIQADTSGRALRYVYVGGEMVNEVLLASGHALVSGFPGEFRYKDRLTIAQETARALSRGVWAAGPDPTPATPLTGESGATAEPFRGGTIPSRPSSEEVAICDFTGTPQPVIKGIFDSSTGAGVYFKPGDPAYVGEVVDVTAGDRWFCTELEAIDAGWDHSPS
jgi:endonuclease YncB( thermonuclease family)